MRRGEVINLPGGGIAFVDYQVRTPKCTSCGGHSGTLLCDYPTGKGTCDKALCRTCAVHVGRNRDYCPSHPNDQAVLALR